MCCFLGLDSYDRIIQKEHDAQEMSNIDTDVEPPARRKRHTKYESILSNKMRRCFG